MTTSPPVPSDEGLDSSGLRTFMQKWLSASPVSWITLGITLTGFAINFGYTYATIKGDAEITRYQIQRNREEALDRIKSVEGSVANIYTSMSAIHSIKIDVEVIKAQMQSINEAIRRIEQQGKKQQR